MNTSIHTIEDKSNRISTRSIAWAIWVTASIFYAYQYVLRVMPNIMMNDIMQQFNIDAAVFGQFSGIYYMGYSLIHLPIGIMLDRFGPKKVMPICILMTSLGLLPILFSDHWVYSIVGRAFIGMGSSAAILGTFKVIRLIFCEEKFTRMLSFSVTIGLIGAIYGGAPIHYLCSTLGYQTVTVIFVGTGVVLSMITYCIMPNKQAEKISENLQHENSIIDNIKSVFSSPKVMAICVLSGLMVGPLEGFADVWGSQFLIEVYGLEKGLAVSLPSVIFIGMCFGAPVLSFIAEKCGDYFNTLIVAGIVMAMAFFALLTGKVPVTGISILFIIVGVCCAYQIIAIYKASTYVNNNVAGLTTAVANMVIMIFGYVFHTLIGSIVQGSGGITNPEALINGIWIIPIALVAAIGGFWKIKKNA